VFPQIQTQIPKQNPSRTKSEAHRHHRLLRTTSIGHSRKEEEMKLRRDGDGDGDGDKDKVYCVNPDTTFIFLVLFLAQLFNDKL